MNNCLPFRSLQYSFITCCLLFGSSIADEVVIKDGFSSEQENLEIVDSVGVGGQGWLSGWSLLQRGPSENFSIKLSDADSSSPDEKYLLVTRSGEKGNVVVSRSLDLTAIDLHQPYSISFWIRLEDLGDPEEEFRFFIGGYADDGSEPRRDNATWYITAQTGRWLLYAGEKAEKPYRNTEIPLEVGVRYHFVIHLWPERKGWTVAIETGKQTYTSPELSFSNVSDGEMTVASKLVFDGLVHRNGKSRFSWSLGGLTVQGSK